MNAALQSPFISPTRSSVKPCVTRTIRVVDAVGIESVCTAGALVSIRFATRDGIVQVRAPLRAFVEKCRGPLDSNNRPFELGPSAIKQLEDDADRVPVTLGGPKNDRNSPARFTRGKLGLSREIVSVLREAYDAWRHRGVDERFVDIAARAGCSTASVSTYFRTWRSLDAQHPNREPVAKPSGKLL